MPSAFLAVSVVGLMLVANALRPLRPFLLAVPAFFAAWLIAELAPQLAVLTVVAAVLFSIFGGLSAPAGWVALALSVLALAGQIRLIASSEAAAAVADSALAELPEPPPSSDAAVTSGLRRFFVSLSFRHPDVERTAGVPYFDESPRQRLDVYRHRDHPAACPTLLQVHGGGWVIGDKRQQGRPLMLHLAARGWVCFAPNYRRSPRATWPDHLVDVKRALAWIRAHGEDYGADPGFVVVTGGSAGGHLAAMAALTPNDPRYQPGFEGVDTSVAGCVPYYGAYDMVGRTGTTMVKVRRRFLLEPLVFKNRDDAVHAEASPLDLVAQARPEAVPPFLVIHGRNDTLVPVEEARLFVERLRAVSSVPVLYMELPGTQHAFDVFPSIRTAHVVRAVGRYLHQLHSRQPAG